MGTLACLDTSVLVALFKPGTLTQRAERFLEEHPTGLVVSDFAAAEFSSAAARWVRRGEMAIRGARAVLTNFDAWTAGSTRRAQLDPTDLIAVTGYLRRLDLPLRTPDAIHIAMAQRLGATLVTFDRQMAESAGRLGCELAVP